jgi:hypothetical protein
MTATPEPTQDPLSLTEAGSPITESGTTITIDWTGDLVVLDVYVPGGTTFRTTLTEQTSAQARADLERAEASVRRYQRGGYHLPGIEALRQVSAELGLPRDWRAVEVLPGTPYPDELDENVPTGWYVMGGQPGDDEATPYVLRVEQSPESDDETAARALAARLNGGAA